MTNEESIFKKEESIEILKNYWFNWSYKINLCCIKCLKFANNNDIKIKKNKIDGNINPYSYCNKCCYEGKVETIDEDELKCLIENFNLYLNNIIALFEV